MARPAEINTEMQDAASFSLPEQAHKHSQFRSKQENLGFKKQLVFILCQCVRKLICSSIFSVFRNIYFLLYGFRANAGMNGFLQNLSNEKFLMCC